MDVFAGLLAGSAPDGQTLGVAIAIVTNTKDPEGLGRVKLRMPWLADDVESDWARVVTPMAGAGRGVYFLPEVDDEVLVAFGHGNPDAPFVLGGLWNGKDKPPETNADGKNAVRSITSRSGHKLRLVDTAGEERIEIVDKTGKNQIAVNAKDNSIAITADGDVTITSTKGAITLKAQKGIAVTSQGTASVEAKQSLELKANGQLTVKGSTVAIN